MPTSQRQVVLIKHAEPQLVPDVTAERWHLADAGRTQCGPLAERLRLYGLSRLITSTEPKAIETGQVLAKRLALPLETEPGLHEHDRSNVRLVPRPEFEQRMADFFAHPDTLVYGRETADETHRRFRAALDTILREYPDERLGIVTHGTVMALLLARAGNLDAFALWTRLATPSFVVTAWPTWPVLEEVDVVA